jgi:hypothetical protein
MMPAGPAVRAAAVVLGAALTASVLSGCYADVGALQHRTRSYSVPGPVQSLVVNGQVGSIHVTGGALSTVRVTEHISYRHTAPATTHRAAAGTVTLDSNCPALETCSVGYDITLPRAATVRVLDGVGTIRLESLSGPVTAHTNVGDIDLASVSGPLEITGHAGSIHGQDVSSARATLRVSAGKVEVAFSAAPAAVTAAATVGSVTLRVPGTVAYDVTASVSVGSTHVGVTLDPASSHVITASATTGSVTVEPAS